MSIDVARLNTATGSLIKALIDAYEAEGKNTTLSSYETCLVTLSGTVLFSAKMLSLLPSLGLTADGNYLETTVAMFRRALEDEMGNGK